jgi:hypothetical protein
MMMAPERQWLAQRRTEPDHNLSRQSTERIDKRRSGPPGLIFLQLRSALVLTRHHECLESVGHVPRLSLTEPARHQLGQSFAILKFLPTMRVATPAASLCASASRRPEGPPLACR